MSEQLKIEKLLRDVGEVLLSYWPGGKKASKKLDISEKSDGSIVTKADEAANELLSSTLLSIYPDDLVVSEEEESSFGLLAESSKGRGVWIIDPLDGTSHFAHGLDDFSVLAARKLDGAIVSSYMYFPALELFLSAEGDIAATENASTIEVSDTELVRNGKLHVRNCDVSKQELCDREPYDSGYAFRLLCVGKLDGIIIRMSNHKLWDLAAPSLILKNAGGKMTTESGAEIPLGSVYPDYKYLVASNGACHEELLALVPKE